MKTKLNVRVDHVVEVEVDESKFDETFMREFRESFYEFDTIQQHVEHLAQMEARGILNSPFIEGYGPAADMGIKTWTIRSDVEVEPVAE